jgi:hypothetical protein
MKAFFKGRKYELHILTPESGHADRADIARSTTLAILCVDGIGAPFTFVSNMRRFLRDTRKVLGVKRLEITRAVVENGADNRHAFWQMGGWHYLEDVCEKRYPASGNTAPMDGLDFYLKGAVPNLDEVAEDYVRPCRMIANNRNHVARVELPGVKFPWPVATTQVYRTAECRKGDHPHAYEIFALPLERLQSKDIAKRAA